METETPSAADEQDRALVKRCLDGEPEAVGALVDRYQKRLFNVALRMLGNEQDAEDVTQTVFLNVYLNLRRYDPRYRFFSWIYRMTVNESLNALKRRKPTVTLEDVFVGKSSNGSDDQVDKALRRLTPDDRALVVLCHFMAFSYDEIAEVLEIPVKTVKSRLYTARERLRSQLNE